jgi:hypothetical protein
MGVAEVKMATACAGAGPRQPRGLAAHPRQEFGPRLHFRPEAVLDPGAHQGDVAGSPLAMDAGLGRLGDPLLLFEGGAELRVLGAQPRRDGGVDAEQIELVPPGVDHGRGQRDAGAFIGGHDFAHCLPLPLHSAAEEGGEAARLRRQEFSQQPRLSSADIRQRIVVVASARLAVAEEVEQTHR